MRSSFSLGPLLILFAHQLFGLRHYTATPTTTSTHNVFFPFTQLPQRCYTLQVVTATASPAGESPVCFHGNCFASDTLLLHHQYLPARSKERLLQRLTLRACSRVSFHVWQLHLICHCLHDTMIVLSVGERGRGREPGGYLLYVKFSFDRKLLH